MLDDGAPRLGAIQKFKVTVTDVNSAPVLASIANRIVNEGRLLTFTNRVTNADLPKQNLTFSLGAGAPPGAAVDPITGVFTWRPTHFQGGTTNRIVIVVRDDGTPNLESVQTFDVIVRDTRSDFTVSVGTTNLLAGQSGRVPLFLVSGGDMSQFAFQLSAPDAHLVALHLQPAGEEVASASFEPSDDGGFQVRVEFTGTVVPLEVSVAETARFFRVLTDP